MKLYEYIDKCLDMLGVDKIFGVPGSLIMPIWQGLKNKEIVLCSHEQEATYIATGYAKKTRKPVCVLTTGGPGVTNSISGIASANIDSVPLIYISGRTPISQAGNGLRQEESSVNRLFDSNQLLKGITKKSICINQIDNASEKIWNAIKLSVEGRAGAVHISVPIDIQNCEMHADTEQCKLQKKNIPHVIKISDRPLFIMGWGCWMADAVDDVYALASSINAPVFVTSKAYCCIDEQSSVFVGKLGYGYNSILDDFINIYNPDSVIVFGSSLGEKDIKGSILKDYIDSKKFIFIANDCSFIKDRNWPCKYVEIADLSSYLNLLLNTTPNRPCNKDIITKIIDTRSRTKNYWNKQIQHGDNMALCIRSINNLLDEDIVITADAGNHLANAGALIDPLKSSQMFLDVGIRSMGNGICMTVGMAMADKSKIYIAITGDGCMLMNGNVMHLAHVYDLPITFIVFNNQSLGRVRVGQSLSGNYRATDIADVDFISYGNTFGLETYRFDKYEDFCTSLKDIVSKRKPTLIEVKTGKDEIPVAIKNNIY